MPPPEVLESPREVPRGSHAVSFYADEREAAGQAASFLEGTPEGEAAMYWVADRPAADVTKESVGDTIPDHVGCVAILPGEQVAPKGGKLRPVDEVIKFVSDHPEGVTAAGDTLSRYWTPETVPQHLEYAAWFEEQPRDGSRFLCPYALDRVPTEAAPQVMHELGSHHSHVILSNSDEPGVRLLQLFIFDSATQIPERLESHLGWAVKRGLVIVHPFTMALTLTPAGDRVVRDWGRHDRPAWK